MPTRRSILTAAAGVVAGATAGALPLGPALAGPPAPDPVGTQARRVAARAGKTLVAEAANRMTHLGIAWHGPAEGAALRIRTSSGWSDWRTVAGCGAARGDGAPDLAPPRGALVPAPGAVGYELTLPPGAVNGIVHELDTSRAEVRPSSAKPGIAAKIPSPYLCRSAWGADESLRFAPDGTEIWPAQYFPVQALTVHHTGMPETNDDPDPAATMRGIYYFHTVTRAWGDIGYHLAIDEKGRVYECRWSGADPIPVFGTNLTPEGRPQMVNAGHAGGWNAGNIGVLLLGEFTKRQPTKAARRTLTYVLAALATVCGLEDPAGKTNYVNPLNGNTRTVDTISGHRDWNATECPGNAFYPYLADVRRDVADLVG